MKIYHFTLIFAFFAVIMCAVVSWRVSEENYVSTDNSANERIFDDAVDAATAVLMKTEDGNLSIDKEAAVEAFFTSMFASLGIVDMPMEMTELEMYVPVIAVTCDDGLYICHNEILPDKDGDFEINRTWTDKIPYSYDDGYFIYRFTNGNTVTVYDYNCYLAATPDVYKADPTQISEFDHFVEVVANIPSAAWPVCLLTNETLFEEIRVKVISETMEEYLNYYCNEHNMIAQQKGIMYKFAMPVIDGALYMRAATNTSFLAFFQGYPIAGTQKTYNQYAVSNAQLVEANLITMDDAGYYHRHGCSHVGNVIGSAYSIEECVQQGAWACDYCYPDTGAHKGAR